MNFGGDEVKYSYEDSAFVIVPVPYDQTSTWIKGSEKGPEAILEASVNLEFYDIETSIQAHLKGIFTADPVVSSGSPESLVNAVYDRITKLLKEGKYPVIIGGNHTVTIGSASAFADYYEKLSVLQLDAHADLREEYNGSRYNHACVMARVREKADIVQVGIRSMSAGEVPLIDRERLFFAHNLFNDKNLYRKALEKLTENVYITIDLDVFDPSLIPSTGTPEPGGPDYFELMHFLAEVIREKNVVGFDVVELCPSPENKVPDFVAAKIIYQLLSYVVGKTLN
jgi:agmatinase